MEQAASQLHQPAMIKMKTFPRPVGGTLRSGLQSAGYAALFASGLYLWLWPDASLILWLHLVLGLGLLALTSVWLVRHVPAGLAHSQRPVFTWLSWGLLAAFVIVMLSGAVMSLPALVWLSGSVWFPAREVTETLSLLHFWGSWIALPGLVLHLAMRHWAW